MNKSPREILDIYNNESGFLGISGISSDFRVIEKCIIKMMNMLLEL